MDIPREVVIVHTGTAADGSWAEARQVGIDGALTLSGTNVTIATAAILRRHAEQAGGFRCPLRSRGRTRVRFELSHQLAQSRDGLTHLRVPVDIPSGFIAVMEREHRPRPHPCADETLFLIGVSVGALNGASGRARSPLRPEHLCTADRRCAPHGDRPPGTHLDGTWHHVTEVGSVGSLTCPGSIRRWP